jgi:hypothetical protein
VACENKDLNESAPITSNGNTNARSANLLYEEDMEGSSLFSTALALEICATNWT